MRRGVAVLGVGVALLLASTARADDSSTEGWDGEVRADLAGSYDLARPRAPDGPLVRSGTVVPQLTGAYFLHPLTDDPDVPLALLEFYQHPGRLELSLDQTTDLDRVDTRWRIARRELGVSASGTGYIMEDTGVRASFAADYSGVAGDSHNAIALSYAAGVIHYFRPNLRGALDYVGSAGQSSRVVSSTTQPALEDLETASNAGRLTGEAILLQDRLGLRAQIEVGEFTEDQTRNALVGTALPGEFTNGLLFDATAAATGYFGRQFSASLEAGVRGRNGDTRPDAGASGAVTRTTLTPVVAPSASFFFRENLFVTVRLTLAYPNVDASGAPSSTGSDNTLSGGLALRF